MSSHNTLLCSYIFWSAGIMDCVSIVLKNEFHLCARGCLLCGIFYYHRWTASVKPRLLYSQCKLMKLSFLLFSFPRLNYNRTYTILQKIIFHKGTSLQSDHVTHTLTKRKEMLMLFWHRNILCGTLLSLLHHCVVIFFWSSGIMECTCTCMLFTFENGVPLLR